MNRCFVAAFATALLLVPGSAPAQEDPEGAPPASAEGEAAPDPDEIFAAEMAGLVERIRGLRFKEPVARNSKSREAVRRAMLPGAEKESGGGDPGPSEDTRVLAFLGLLPPEQRAEEAQARFTAESASGYYDSRTRTFTIVEDARTNLTRMVVFHELVHAVEDQHFGLDGPRRAYRKERKSDHYHSWKALVEGSAQLFTERFLDSEEGLRTAVAHEVIGTEIPWKRRPAAKGDGKEGGEGGGGAVAPRPSAEADEEKRILSVPPYLLIRNGMFYYHNGARFLDALLAAREGDEPEGDLLAAVYADPPVSTEMILHPEKYLAPRDLPREVRLPDLAPILGEGWERVAVDTLGEFGMGLALNRWRFSPDARTQLIMVLEVPPGGFRSPEDLLHTPLAFTGDTAKAVEGWDGDRIALYERGEETCAVWVSAWDGEEDAKEFAALFVRILSRKHRGLPRGEDDPATAVVAEGDRVLVAERVPAAAVERVLEALRTAEVVRDPADALPGE